MRILLQRVSRAEVRIRPEPPGDEPRVSGRIQSGYLLLVGFTHTDTEAELQWMTDKHKMPPLPEKERKIVLDYLEATFPPRTAPAGRGGWQNPFSPR